MALNNDLTGITDMQKRTVKQWIDGKTNRDIASEFQQ